MIYTRRIVRRVREIRLRSFQNPSWYSNICVAGSLQGVQSLRFHLRLLQINIEVRHARKVSVFTVRPIPFIRPWPDPLLLELLPPIRYLFLYSPSTIIFLLLFHRMNISVDSLSAAPSCLPTPAAKYFLRLLSHDTALLHLLSSHLH
jgi:hypothetical protein